MNELKFNTIIYYDDYNSFLKAASSKIVYSHKKLGGFFYFGVFLASLALFSSDIVLAGIQSNFLPIIITILAMTCLFFLVQVVIKEKMKPLPNGSLIGVHEYTLTDEKIIVQKGDHRASSTYNSILNIVESENNLFLFIDSFNAYIINKKNISSELPLDEITLYLREKCNIKVEVVNTDTGKAVKVAKAPLSFIKTTLFYAVVAILGWCIIEFITALKDVHQSRLDDIQEQEI